MSSVWKQPTYSLRQQEQQWLNLFHTAHDQFCHCDDPTFHFLIVINRGSQAPKPESDVKNIQCLLTGIPATKEDTTPEDVVTGFDDGELEKLFSENTEEENGPDAAR